MIRQAIASASPTSDLRDVAARQGMRTLLSNGYSKVDSGALQAKLPNSSASACDCPLSVQSA